MTNLTRRIAIIGSGPSGFYAADALFRTKAPLQVDIFERFPVPFGLVRHGVAPDQKKIKSVTRAFERIADNQSFGFYGNVRLGKDISISDLNQHYDAILLAVGATEPKKLGIPGEELPGSYTSTEFVGWYNGHPDYALSTYDFSSEYAVVIGNGNVALDVARVLAKGAEGLQDADIPAYALNALQKSKIREIIILGRRGPVQASFTLNELKALKEIQDCQLLISKNQRSFNPASQSILDDPANRLIKRNVEEMLTYDAEEKPAKRRIRFLFCHSPVSIDGTGRVTSITIRQNKLVEIDGSVKAVPTDKLVNNPAGLIVSCLGYRGKAIEGVPFDHNRGIVPNDAGRVKSGDIPMPGLYVSGWIKAHARGIIGDTKADSAETVRTLMEDLPAIPPCPKPAPNAIAALLQARGIQEVAYESWQQLDEEEKTRGAASGKPREKFTHVSDMMAFLQSIS